MRIYADVNRLPDTPPENLTIIQVAPSPPVGTVTPINGKFVVDIPDGVFPPTINENSCLIDTGTSYYITGPIYDSLRQTFPGYANVLFNQLLTSADIALLDLAATFPYDPGPPVKTWPTRCQVGRGGAPPLGVAPGSIALLPENMYTSPTHPGLLVTSTIDISAMTGGLGASNFLVYWKVYQVYVDNDVMDYSTGTNTPALKNLVEINQDDVKCFLSVNDGAGYTPAPRLTPCVTCAPGTLVRLAFVNHQAYKAYLMAYALIF